METKNGIKAISPKNRKAWRTWLDKNGGKEKSAWLVLYKKESANHNLTYAEAVEEALCFGWIDSKPNGRDEESWYQFFSQRKPKSNWSKINKQRVEGLIADGQMTQRGMALVDAAKKNGAWTALDDISELRMPDDLKKALAKNKAAQKNFDAFPASVKKGILEWILNAKREETRSKRIAETVALAAENRRAAQYTPKK